MIDYNDHGQALKISMELCRYAKQYSDARRYAADAKYNLDIILASRMSELRRIKSNLGYETAQIMLLEDGNQEIQSYYKELLKQTAQYRGLEKVISSLESQISLIQSLIKNQPKQGE